MRYFLIFAFSLPVFAQDWGRYTQPTVVPHSIAEMQVIQMPRTAIQIPQYVQRPVITPKQWEKIHETPPNVPAVKVK